MNIEVIENIGIVLSVIVSVIIAIKKIRQYINPIKIVPSTTMVFDNSGPDSISADITNISGSTIYVKNCSAREIKNKKRILREKTKAELSRFINERNAKFDCRSYGMMGSEPLKLENGESIKLNHKLNFNHPLAGFFNLEFVVEVKLTNGKIITSKRTKVPLKWLHPIMKKVITKHSTGLAEARR